LFAALEDHSFGLETGRIYRSIRDRNADAARDAMRDHLMLAQKAQEQEEQVKDKFK